MSARDTIDQYEKWNHMFLRKVTINKAGEST